MIVRDLRSVGIERPSAHEGLLLFPDALERLVVGLLVDELAGRCILLDPLVKLWVIDL
jgi:hypothetical protein